jgi:hypothetical protein
METGKLTCVGEFGVVNSATHTNQTPDIYNHISTRKQIQTKNPQNNQN